MYTLNHMENFAAREVYSPPCGNGIVPVALRIYTKFTADPYEKNSKFAPEELCIVGKGHWRGS